MNNLTNCCRLKDVITIKLPRSLGIRRIVIKTNVLTIGILITGLLSVALTLLTYYGSHSGNFIVVYDDDNALDYKSITLSEDPLFTNPAPRLFADSVTQSYDMTYIELDMEEIIKTDGNYHDPDYKYLAYTFYLKNNGTETVDVGSSMVITDSYQGTEKAIRVILIKDSIYSTMYQLKDDDNIPTNYQPDMPVTTPFINDKQVFSDTIPDLEPNQIKKFTIIIYLEGQDPDCSDGIIGGRIKMSLKFEIVDEA